MRDTRHTFANPFRRSDLTIGARLTACFLTIVVLMTGADAVAIWQLRQMAAHTEMLNTADQVSSAIVRLHLDVNSFSGRVAILTRSHDTRQFANEAALVRETFLQHVRGAEQILKSSPEIAQDAFISGALKTLKTTLPSQIDSEMELANAGDWTAIQLRLTGLNQDLIDLSSLLVQEVEDRVFQQRARVNEETEQARHRLFIVVPVAWLLTLLAAAALGWFVTKTITVPLSELTTGARALACGDFRHEINATGNDELAVLGKALNHAARQLRHQFEITLEARVGERTRIARELHDTLLQSFHGVMLHFQTGINQLPEHPAEPRTAEARKTLEKAMHLAKHAIVEGREAIQGLRSSVVETNDLALAMRTLGEELAANANSTAFQVHVEGTPRDLHPIVRDEVFRIAGEAMRNAFRHADAEQIEVEIHYDDRRLRVRVRDDGKGIDPKLLSEDGREGHFGLRGMRERAKLIGGKLTVWSELDAGTELELSIPATNAYATPDGGRRSWLAEKLAGKDTETKS